MTYYKCKNCNYKTSIFSDIKKHINLKKLCITELNIGFEYSKDQIVILSLIPYNKNNKQDIDEDKVKDVKNIYENRNELINILSESNKDKKKICKFCHQHFLKLQDLRTHLLLECFSKEINKNKDINISNNKDINISNKDINITNNIINNNNVTNNIIQNITANITVQFESLVPFEQNWDLSKISDLEKKFEILCSDIMYTSLLNKILENNVNLNVVIDKNKNIGFIYQNKDNKYIKMNIEDITENSMEKLHDNLLEINNNLIKKESIYKDLSEFNEERIKKKLTDYKKIPDTKKKVNEFIADMFDKKKQEAYEISKNMNNLLNLGY